MVDWPWSTPLPHPPPAQLSGRQILYLSKIFLQYLWDILIKGETEKNKDYLDGKSINMKREDSSEKKKKKNAQNIKYLQFKQEK